MQPVGLQKSSVHGLVSGQPSCAHTPPQQLEPAGHDELRRQVVRSVEHMTRSHALEGMQLVVVSHCAIG
jgi:hypothetical protein